MEYPKFFRKAVRGGVGGYCLNKKGDTTEYLLKGDPNDPSIEEDEITLEIYDEDGENYFFKKNKGHIKNGYLIEVGESGLSVDFVNAVSDGYLKDLLKEHYMSFRKKVNGFTSSTPVQRLLQFALDEDKPYKTIEFLKARIAELEAEDGIATSNVITDGTTKAGTA